MVLQRWHEGKEQSAHSFVAGLLKIGLSLAYLLMIDEQDALEAI